MTARMPADPFTSGNRVADLLDDGEALLLGLAEAGGRGALAPALDALLPDEQRTALLFWLVEVRLAIRAIARRGGSLPPERDDRVYHFEAGDVLHKLMIEAIEVEESPAQRIALRLDALTDEIVATLIQDVLQVRR